jgi:ABC-type branched-subunit amino acid transport system ATPase component
MNENAAEPALLSVQHVSHSFGGVKALDDASLDVNGAEITALIGPNGAGKSTLIDVVTGRIRLQAGHVRFAGSEMSGSSLHQASRMGLVRSFQIPGGFSRMSVIESMMVASRGHPGESMWRALFRSRHARDHDAALAVRSADILERFGLTRVRDHLEGELSGGQRKLLDFARAIATGPKMIVLDEPMAGVNPTLVQRLAAHIKEIHSSGVGVLVVEHNLEIVEELCSRVIVMVNGQVLAVGTMEALRHDDRVVAAYLGRDRAA